MQPEAVLTCQGGCGWVTAARGRAEAESGSVGGGRPSVRPTLSHQTHISLFILTLPFPAYHDTTPLDCRLPAHASTRILINLTATSVIIRFSIRVPLRWLVGQRRGSTRTIDLPLSLPSSNLQINSTPALSYLSKAELLSSHHQQAWLKSS
jgi:hypothetical protein